MHVEKHEACPHCGEVKGWSYDQQYCGNCDWSALVAARYRQAASVARTGLSRAAEDVLSERRRQVGVEGWTPEHDDGHVNGELAEAAACYILTNSSKVVAGLRSQRLLPDLWPWAIEWWKPKDRRRDLVRAAALIIAEIERLDRRSRRPSEQ